MANVRPVQDLPDWLPEAVRLYLDHTEEGLSLRELARREGRHASTIMRQVRRYENRRDDPLVDEALVALARNNTKDTSMTAARAKDFALDDARIAAEARRVLRRMAEPGAVLGFAPDMEKAAVLREFPDGQTARTAVVDRAVAQAFALKNWIAPRKTGRITTYEITTVGRLHVRQLIEEEDRARHGMAEAPSNFNWNAEDEEPRRPRYALAESPVAAMGRRRDKDGNPFLEPELVAAAERLREDFELAQMGPRVTQNWERFLDGGDRSQGGEGGRGPAAARDRVAAALRDLGPGLGDMVLRCCCYLEGLEIVEKRMGWAARSGKVVLRIALQRLRRHYQEAYGRAGPLIG